MVVVALPADDLVIHHLGVNSPVVASTSNKHGIVNKGSHKEIVIELPKGL